MTPKAPEYKKPPLQEGGAGVGIQYESRAAEEGPAQRRGNVRALEDRDERLNLSFCRLRTARVRGKSRRREPISW